MLLAYSRNGSYLDSGVLTLDNKLDGEGPFRVIPPQKLVGPPDQSVKSDAQDVIWPFEENADHNAGFASRSATIIKVDPLPEGTTDIDIFEAGWDYVDEGKIVVYGAIDPKGTVLIKLMDFKALIKNTPGTDFAHNYTKRHLLWKTKLMRWLLKNGHDDAVLRQLSRMSKKFDGCERSNSADRNDWVLECDSQQSLYWAIHEMTVLLKITN